MPITDTYTLLKIQIASLNSQITSLKAELAVTMSNNQYLRELVAQLERENLAFRGDPTPDMDQVRAGDAQDAADAEEDRRRDR